ncbi:MAG: hypothetical protein JXR83_08485, partial [Deltaproteobacteria bacterium]|nr:hypothetical protein [Deltaproteobacteria bacterium]
MTQQPAGGARYWLATIVGGVVCVGVAAALGVSQHSAAVAIVALALGGVGLLRPEIGALGILALAVPDLVATVEVGRFTVRASQVLAAGTAFGALALLLRRGTLLATLRRLAPVLGLFVGFALLAAIRLWALGAPNPVKGYAYAAWGLFVAIAVAGSLASVLRTPEQIGRGLAVLTAAIAIIAMFGIAQWTIGVAGGKPPLVTQWIGHLPRINGLSYEPSYFAMTSALALCLAVAAFLGEKSFLRQEIAAGAAAILALALVLSTSRSGWLGLAVVMLCALVIAVGRWRRLRPLQRCGLWSLLAAVLLGGLLLNVVRPDDFGEFASRSVDVTE